MTQESTATTDEPRDLYEDLRNAATQIDSIDAEIKGLQEKKNEVKTSLVKHHGIKIGDFNTVLRWCRLEDEDRNEMLDNIRKCCQALGITAQVDLFAEQSDVNTDQPELELVK